MTNFLRRCSSPRHRGQKSCVWSRETVAQEVEPKGKNKLDTCADCADYPITEIAGRSGRCATALRHTEPWRRAGLRLVDPQAAKGHLLEVSDDASGTKTTRSGEPAKRRGFASKTAKYQGFIAARPKNVHARTTRSRSIRSLRPEATYYSLVATNWTSSDDLSCKRNSC